MHKKFLLLVLLLCFAFLSACIEGQLQLKDCGNDKECFDNAAKQCMPAKVLISEERNGTLTKLYLESRGESVDGCEFYYQIQKLQVVLSKPESEKEKKLQEEFFAIIKTVEGKDMVCKFPKQLVEDKNSPMDIEAAEINQYCEGELIIALQDMQQALLALIAKAQQSEQ